jgi:hypothetical protein
MIFLSIRIRWVAVLSALRGRERLTDSAFALGPLRGSP